MSLAKYCSLRSRGDDSLVAIPVFPSRVFRHSAIYVRAGDTVRAPSDLVGRRIGIPEWTQTAGVYVRGMLADEHGVGIDQVDWVQAGLNEPGREELVPPALRSGIRYRAVADRRLGDLLLEGEVDAIISARAPDVFLDGSGRVRRLFDDPQAAEEASLEATGIFPIMHTVAIRRDVFDEHPWLAPNLVEAFEESKRRSLRRLLDDSVARLPIPWASSGVERAVRLLGADPWPYGIESNRTTLEAFLRYAHEQGICARSLTPEELFPPSVQRTYRV
jgi:4,5-dihydroxyphthalate decarboxylase